MNISEEVARDQFQEFLDYYDLDPSVMPEDQRAAFESSASRIIKAVRSGKLEFGQDGTVKQFLKKPVGEVSEIKYEELSGMHKVAMKSKKGEDHYGRMYALLGSLSGLGEMGIMKLKGADLSVAESVGIIFLQV